MENNIDILIYRKNYSDSILCKWITKKHLLIKKKVGVNDDTDTSFYKEKNILFVNICPSNGSIKKLLKNKNSITIIDNSKSTEEILNKKMNIKIYYDINKTASQILWDILTEDRQRPWFIDYIADKCLNRWKLSNSKYINLGLFHEGEINIEKLDFLFAKDDKYKDVLCEKGMIIDKNNNIELDQKIKNASLVKFLDTDYVVLLSTCSYNLKMDLCNKLTNIKINDIIPDFAVVWNYDFKSNEWILLLSGSNNSPDLSIIASKYGGKGNSKQAEIKLFGGTLKKYFTMIEYL